MGYEYADVYYQPETFGLTVFGELDDPEGCYSFDMLVVWLHEDGRLFYAVDSGCSCPSPFEDFRSLEQLTEVTDENYSSFETDVLNHCPPYDNTSTRGRGSSEFRADKAELLGKVSRHLYERSKA